MKKITLLLLTILILSYSGCTGKIETSNDKTENHNKIITRVEECSFITQAGEETGRIDLDNEVIVFISKGKSVNQDEELKYYIDEADDITRLYFAFEVNGVEKRIHNSCFYESGVMFTILNDESYLNDLRSIDGIRFFQSLNDENIVKFGIFDNVINKNGHLFYLEGNRIYRSTIHGNEKTKLVGAPCSKIKYKDGWIYYIREHQLFKINEQGDVKELIYEDNVIDYFIDGDNILILSEDNDRLDIKIIDSESYNIKDTARLQLRKKRFNTRIIGVIDGTIYLARNSTPFSNAKEDLAILSVVDNELEDVTFVDKKADIEECRPFIVGNNIYYVTYKGLYKYDVVYKVAQFLAEINSSFGVIQY